jgi:hypothetical protein
MRIENQHGVLRGYGSKVPQIQRRFNVFKDHSIFLEGPLFKRLRFETGRPDFQGGGLF